jgi:hypothetical protein
MAIRNNYEGILGFVKYLTPQIHPFFTFFLKKISLKKNRRLPCFLGASAGLPGDPASLPGDSPIYPGTPAGKPGVSPIYPGIFVGKPGGPPIYPGAAAGKPGKPPDKSIGPIRSNHAA